MKAKVQINRSLYHPHLTALIYLKSKLAMIENQRADWFEKGVYPDRNDLEEIAFKIESLKNSIKLLQNLK